MPEAPPGGVIVSDPGLGVFCDNAMDAIIAPIAPKPDAEQHGRWLKAAMSELNKVGIIGVSNAGMRLDEVSVLESVAQKGELTMRISIMLECAERNTYCPKEIKLLSVLKSFAGVGEGILKLGGVKIFADGALGSWGAALLEPYSDKPETSGTMLINETELTAVVKNWFYAGYQVNIHAIGDKANRAAVDAFESVLGANCNGCNEIRRLRIEHAQIIHPDDQKRIAKMGIIPSIQPTHATSDMAYAVDRLGEERLSHSAYRMASLFPPLGSTSKYPGPVLGSDFPVEPANPFHGMYAAVTRLDPHTGESPVGPEGWYPEEALTVEQAILGFTKNAAYAWFEEDKAGAIEVGKWADFIIINKDIWADESGKSLRDVEVLETWVGGKKVYPVQSNAQEEIVSQENATQEDWFENFILGIGDTIIGWMPEFISGLPPAEFRNDPDYLYPGPPAEIAIRRFSDYIRDILPQSLGGRDPEQDWWTDPEKEAPITNSAWLEQRFIKIGETILGWLPEWIVGMNPLRPDSTFQYSKAWLDNKVKSMSNTVKETLHGRPTMSGSKETKTDKSLFERMVLRLGQWILNLFPTAVVGEGFH
jgi:predicted amidohydrolase YtcJ